MKSRWHSTVHDIYPERHRFYENGTRKQFHNKHQRQDVRKYSFYLHMSREKYIKVVKKFRTHKHMYPQPHAHWDTELFIDNDSNNIRAVG